MDLQDIYRSHPKLLIATLAAFLAVIVVVIVLTLSGGSGAPQPNGQARTHHPGSRTASTVTVPNPNYHPSYIAHFRPSSVDQRIANEFAASPDNTAEFEAVKPAKPGWTAAFPRVPSATTTSDRRYLTEFMDELLNVNYKSQSRLDLERWVSAESGGEMLPGEPRAAAVHALYGELFTPRAVGDSPGPVPNAAAWAQDARRGVVQRASEITVTGDPAWARAVSAGLTSVDPLLQIDDVSGELTTTTQGHSTTRRFSAEVLLSSALHHPGYGVATIDAWTVTR